MPTPVRDSETEMIIKGVKIFAGIVVGVFLLIIFFSCFYQIQSGQEGVLLTFGKASPAAQTATNGFLGGLHLKMPIVQSVAKFDVRTQKYGADATQNTLESAASSDMQQVKMRLTVNYHLASGKTPEIYTNLGAGYQDTVIVPTVHEAVKAVTAKYKAVDLIGKRDEVSGEMKNLLIEKLRPYNIVVEQVSITDFDFGDQFNAAIEAKVTAEQQKQKADNDLERIRVEADQVRTAADGQRDAAIATATGEAARVRLVQEELSKSPQYVEYIKATKWNGQYPQFYMVGGNSPNLLMQLPAVIANNS
jgi:prohibitin 2